jgi:drug/metabolite transporter (DMT)-like permease
VRALAVAPVVGLLFHSRDRRARARAAASRLVPMGLISASNTVTYFVAIDRMSPALVTLVIYVYPALAVVGSWLLGWTRLTGLTAVALSATLGGVLLTIGWPEGSVDPLAVGLALCNATFFACWLLLAQSALRQADAVTCFAAATGSSQVAVLVGSLVLANPEPGSRAAIVACLLGAGVVSTVIAFLLQLHGIARLGGAATALVTSLEIVTVVVLSAILFDDPIGGGILVGGLLVVTGAALAPLSVRPVPTRRPTTAPAEGQ